MTDGILMTDNRPRLVHGPKGIPLMEGHVTYTHHLHGAATDEESLATAREGVVRGLSVQLTTWDVAHRRSDITVTEAPDGAMGGIRVVAAWAGARNRDGSYRVHLTGGLHDQRRMSTRAPGLRVYMPGGYAPALDPLTMLTGRAPDQVYDAVGIDLTDGVWVYQYGGA